MVRQHPVHGPRLARQFFLAPAGEHRAIPAKILPGARQIRRSLRGYDAVVFEAADRSDSALVLAGPYNEATTWFGGPAPDAAGLDRLLRTFRFTDSANGATLVPGVGRARAAARRLAHRAQRATRSSSSAALRRCCRPCRSGPV